MDGILHVEKAGLDVYRCPGRCNKWHLPVCAASKHDALFRLSPNHIGNWEEVDLDGCPTICYRLTGKTVKLLNKVKNFTSFFSILSECLGKGPAKEFFPDLWIRANNIKARRRNAWECKHHCLSSVGSHTSMSIRTAAKMSIY